MKNQCTLIMSATIRYPIPYGDLNKQIVQRFADYADLDKHECTIEEPLAIPIFFFWIA